MDGVALVAELFALVPIRTHTSGELHRSGSHQRKGFCRGEGPRSLAIPGQPVTVVGNPWAREENAPANDRGACKLGGFMRMLFAFAVGINA